MGMRHVRIKKHRTLNATLETYLNKNRVSRVDRIVTIVCSQPREIQETKSVSKKKPRKKASPCTDIYNEYGVSAIGREKRKGKSMPPRGAI